ncbi:hypothetical protein PTSG_07438 [Salpingoeca rosetta]|uniref:Uncharacterized protein n=1 Tax=Salpingoeca rosetta (strain ATCC 50818 / BSB-021) TaxID=946362 RepID=F2UIQ4_SALR5|nr:uncharacterized protein PTSG_07438 [Salpingoeca rosetta]EGD77103.1 hypothetical protein PTSG_07438 [Salpingoeca rosetta]|eukprot:XP_004990942.1 hypothetical protein PTSG_07438 [Salpingoeca rosetta]
MRAGVFDSKGSGRVDAVPFFLSHSYLAAALLLQYLAPHPTAVLGAVLKEDDSGRLVINPTDPERRRRARPAQHVARLQDEIASMKDLLNRNSLRCDVDSGIADVLGDDEMRTECQNDFKGNAWFPKAVDVLFVSNTGEWIAHEGALAGDSLQALFSDVPVPCSTGCLKLQRVSAKGSRCDEDVLMAMARLRLHVWRKHTRLRVEFWSQRPPSIGRRGRNWVAEALAYIRQRRATRERKNYGQFNTSMQCFIGGCDDFCDDNCNAGCDYGCDYYCDSGCDSSCSTNCTSCDDSCDSSCVIFSLGCDSSCDSSCDYCVTTCDDSCDTSCDGGCDEGCDICYSGCDSGCDICYDSCDDCAFVL